MNDMSLDEKTSVRIVRALGLKMSTGAGENDVHRKGPAPPSYGLQELTDGRSRAIAINLPLDGFPMMRRPADAAATPRPMETGWHYHNIDLQLAFIASGDIDIAFADEAWKRHGAGEILVIPGGVPHNAGRASSDYGLVEFTLPGDFGTIECPPHPRDVPAHGFVLDDDRVGSPTNDGVADYLLTPQVSTVADIRLLTAGEQPVETPAKGTCFTLVASGDCDVEVEDASDSLGTWDMLVDDAKQGRARLLNRSKDFRAYQVQLLG
jgi:hypothetical protein